MWTMIMTAALLTGASVQQSDTTFAVDPRGQLRLEDVRGDVTVHTWTRPEVRVGVDPDERRHLHVDAGSSTVRVGFDRPSAGDTDLQLTIPATMGVALTGTTADVHLIGVGGEVSVETVQGDIEVRGGNGMVRVHSVNGDITLADARGRIEAHAASGDLRLQNCSGEVTVELINGDLTLERIDASAVQASTVSGDIHFDGNIREGGHYALTSHSGDITMAVPENAGATITVQTFSGEFESAFPVRLTEQRRGQRFSFGVGSGSARVELQSFSGDIRLVRHGAASGEL